MAKGARIRPADQAWQRPLLGGAVLGSPWVKAQGVGEGMLLPSVPHPSPTGLLRDLLPLLGRAALEA